MLAGPKLPMTSAYLAARLAQRFGAACRYRTAGVVHGSYRISRRPRRALLAVVLAVFVPGAAIAQASEACVALDPQVRRLLAALSSSARRIDYHGVATLQRGGDMQIMTLSHQVFDGQITQEFSRLTGQDAKVFRYAHPMDCLHPGHRLLRSAALPGEGLCAVAASYRFRVANGERIAGREAVRLRVEPLDMYRFGYVFELDRDTALMLKSTTLASDQRVLEQFQFATLDLQSVRAARATTHYEAAHPQPREPRAGAGPSWRIAWLPAGFVPTDKAPARSRRKSFTDGLASFSVFFELLPGAIEPGEGVEREGSTVAYTRGVILDRRPVLVTVLGEIPTNTARMVADSVRLQ